MFNLNNPSLLYAQLAQQAQQVPGPLGQVALQYANNMQQLAQGGHPALVNIINNTPQQQNAPKKIVASPLTPAPQEPSIEQQNKDAIARLQKAQREAAELQAKIDAHLAKNKPAPVPAAPLSPAEERVRLQELLKKLADQAKEHELNMANHQGIAPKPPVVGPTPPPAPAPAPAPAPTPAPAAANNPTLADIVARNLASPKTFAEAVLKHFEPSWEGTSGVNNVFFAGVQGGAKLAQAEREKGAADMATAFQTMLKMKGEGAPDNAYEGIIRNKINDSIAKVANELAFLSSEGERDVHVISQDALLGSFQDPSAKNPALVLFYDQSKNSFACLVPKA